MTPVELTMLFTTAQHPLGADTLRTPAAAQAMENLLGADLVQSADAGTFELAPRGQAFVDHVSQLELPEQVTVWRIGGMAQPLGPGMSHPSVAFRAVQPQTDDGPPPPPAAPAKRINGVAVPDDPEQKRTLGISLMNNGMGVGEVAELLGVSFAEADSYFTGK